jgi:hypothetical protein
VPDGVTAPVVGAGAEAGVGAPVRVGADAGALAVVAVSLADELGSSVEVGAEARAGADVGAVAPAPIAGPSDDSAPAAVAAEAELSGTDVPGGAPIDPLPSELCEDVPVFPTPVPGLTEGEEGADPFSEESVEPSSPLG